jgi:hypothetical protein
MDTNTMKNSKSPGEAVDQKADVKTVLQGELNKNNKKLSIKPWIYLLVVNIVLLAVSAFFIINLPKKAVDLNKARSDEQKVKESKNVDVTGLEYKPTKESVDKLNSFYLEEAGVIDFIESIETLKENGNVKNFSLVGQNAVKDKTGAYGIPFIVELEGGWEKINISLQELQKLPYLVRAIDVDVRVVDSSTINFKYGGFLYVSDKLAKTR